MFVIRHIEEGWGLTAEQASYSSGGGGLVVVVVVI